MAISIQTLTNNLSFSMSLNPLFPKLSISAAKSPPSLVVRMGGGPRTFPGGVSKWQWKRMQAKKSKQLLKARLARERQIYEMRKRAELRAATSELERPWEAVSAVAVAPTLLSVPADEQLKVLADRFQRPGGFDMWTAKDGPQLFPFPDELPSARFFPKGVVHSIKPYRRELPANSGDGDDDPRKDRRNSASDSKKEPAISDSKRNSVNGDRNRRMNHRKLETGSTELASKRNSGNRRNTMLNSEEFSDSERNSANGDRNRRMNQRNRETGSTELASSYSKRNSGSDDQNRLKNQRNSALNRIKNPSKSNGGWRPSGRSDEARPRSERSSDSKRSNSFDRKSDRSEFRTKMSRNSGNRDNGYKRGNDSRSEVYDMKLERDGSYGFR